MRQRARLTEWGGSSRPPRCETVSRRRFDWKMGLADREWMRDGATEAEVARRRRSRRAAAGIRTAAALALAVIAGAAGVLAASHVAKLRPYLHLGGESRSDIVRVRVWVPPARHGHVRVLRVHIPHDR